jgi:predicted peptidase
MTVLKLFAVMIGLLSWLGMARGGGERDSGFVDRIHKDPDGREVKYVLFVPHEYKGDKPYPLILFLHGAGEREGGKKAPVEVGIGPAIKKLGEEKFGFFVLIPRCGPAPGHSWRADGPDAHQALAMLQDVDKDYKIDAKRVYLTGLSMGGFGTWGLAAQHPERWAAIVPICGGGSPKNVPKIRDIPCWCFHGEKDPTVPAEKSREMIKALEAAGGHPKYTEYPGVGHNSWDKAYNTPELYDWLLKQHLK